MTDKIMTRLLTEEDVIEVLALKDRPDPKGSLRWMRRTGKLRPVPNLGRGINRYRPADVYRLINPEADDPSDRRNGKRRPEPSE